MVNLAKCSKSQVGAWMECTDLISNGYILLFAVFDKVSWFIKLHHQNNGRTLVVNWTPNYWMIKEKDKVLKYVPYQMEDRWWKGE